MRETIGRKYCSMETIKLTTHIDDTGTLRLELPTRLANHEVEVLVVLHPTTEQVISEQGWPVHYFEAIDARTPAIRPSTPRSLSSPMLFSTCTGRALFAERQR